MTRTERRRARRKRMAELIEAGVYVPLMRRPLDEIDFRRLNEVQIKMLLDGRKSEIERSERATEEIELVLELLQEKELQRVENSEAGRHIRKEGQEIRSTLRTRKTKPHRKPGHEAVFFHGGSCSGGKR